MRDVFEVFRLRGRAAIVTGAASGIGAAIAEVLAAAGARVALADVDREGAEAVGQRIAASGGEARVFRCDVSKRSEVDALAQEATLAFGRLDVLCNVAGVPSDGSLASVSEEEVDRVLGINLKSVLFACQAALRVMAPQRGGSIVNVASAVIDAPAPGYGLYAMSKAGVASLTQTLGARGGSARHSRERPRAGRHAHCVHAPPPARPGRRGRRDASRRLRERDARTVSARAGRRGDRPGLARAVSRLRCVPLLHGADLARERRPGAGALISQV